MRSIGVKITADISGYISGLARAGAATKDFTGQMDKAAKSGKLDHVADQATKFGVAGVAAFGLVVKSAADFDKQMSAVSAATHANTQDMAALRAAALQAGKDTAYSATEAAKGITELSKAGVSTADVLGGGLKGALSLAAAGQLSVGEAAETAASAMTQFKLKGDQVPHVADLLAAAAGKAQGSVHDLGYALSQSGLVASQMGLSIEDTTGTLAAFASAGLLGSDAGTSFKTMLLALQNPVPKTAEMMKQLGINAYDASGNFVGITKFAGILQEKLANLTPQMRQQALAQIFGNDAVRAGTILYDQGAKGIQGWITKTNDAGYAASTAAKLTDNLSGDIERLKGSLETLAIQSGSGANSGLRVLAKSLNGVVGQFLGMPRAVGATITVMAGVGGAALLGLAGFVKLRKGLSDAVEQLTAMGPAGAKAATGLSRVASVAGKAFAALAALEAIGMVAEHFRDAAVNADQLSNSLVNLQQTGQAAGAITNVFGKDMGKFAQQAGLASDATHGFTGAVNDTLSSIPGLNSTLDLLNEKLQGGSFNKAKSNMQALDQALVDYMNTTNDAAKSSELWNKLLAKSGMDTEQFAALLPNAYKQLGTMNTEAMKARDGLAGVSGAAKGVAGPTGKATAATKEYTSAADAAAGAARGELGALTDLSNRMKAEVNPVFALITAEQALTKAQKDAAAAVKAHGRNSDEARAATRNLALAAIDLQGKAGALGTTFSGKLSPAMVDTLKKANLTDKQIADVGKQFREAKKDGDKYNGKYVANVTSVGIPTVKKNLESLLIQQDALQKGISVSAAASAFRKNAYAVGGAVHGPGTGESDSIPAWLSTGEFVVKATSTKKLGVPALNHINDTGELPRYAAGGAVSMPFKVNAKNTHVISLADALALVTPPGPPSGGVTYPWIIKMVHAAFPGLQPISTFRQGARTLSGNQSLHALGEAVDWPPSQPLAKYWNNRFKSITTELITPYNSLNLYKGQAHRYTGAIWNQHNFAGGNAHDHIGVSGRTGSAGGILGGAIAKGILGMWIAEAIAKAQVSGSWQGPLNTLIMRESGGNPRAQNNWDANARAGHPSKGLMQTIPSTFEAYRMKSLPDNIFDPVANIVAGIRYIKARYGSISNVQQADSNRPAKGYANGGMITEPVFGVGASGQRYTFAENGPERVLPTYARDPGHSGGGNATVYNVNVYPSPLTHPGEVGRQVVGAIQDYERGSGASWRKVPA